MASWHEPGVSGKERLLRILKDGKPRTSKELYDATGCMVHSRVADLRRDGHNIPKAERVGDDYVYRLVPDGGTTGGGVSSPYPAAPNINGAGFKAGSASTAPVHDTSDATPSSAGTSPVPVDQLSLLGAA